MKQYLALALCVLLLLCTILIPGSAEAQMGRGNGRDMALTTASEVKTALLNLFQNKRTLSVEDAIQLSAPTAGYSLQLLSEDSLSAPEYTSCTLKITNQITTKSDYTEAGYSGVNGSGGSSSRMFIFKEMICYMTEQASYYSVCMTTQTRNSYKHPEAPTSESSHIFLDLQVDLYVDNDCCMINFKRFSILSSDPDVASGVNQIPRNQWILISQEDVGEASALLSQVLNVSDRNYDFLGYLGEFIDEKEDTAFRQDGSIYHLKDSYVSSFFEEAYKRQYGQSFDFGEAGQDINASFYFDLSLPTAPTFHFNLSQSVTGSLDGYRYKASNNGSDTLTITNINNTVLEQPSTDSCLTWGKLVAMMEDQANG